MQEFGNGYLTSAILCLGLMISLLAHGLEMEYISPEKQQKLEALFKKSSLKTEKSDSLRKKAWTCDMYGMRTRLQVQKGMKLYSWNSASWKNEGSSPVEEYKAENDELVGKASRFEDRVRMTDDGQLISQLSVTQPKQQVVAYSLCSTP